MVKNFKASDKRITSKCIAERIDEVSEPFVCLVLKPSPQKNRLKKTKYTFDLTLYDDLFDNLLKNNFIRLIDHKVISSLQDVGKQAYCKWHNSFDHSTKNCNMFRQKVQSAINDGRLSIGETHKNYQFAPIGFDSKRLSDW